MAYITLKELKKILPEIMSDWIDNDDESWEWIFQEIEQKCHVGKKGKKNKKVDGIRNVLDPLIIESLQKDMKDLRVRLCSSIDGQTELARQISDIRQKVDILNKDQSEILDNVRKEFFSVKTKICEVKTMAEIAKNRTETDYSKISSSNPTGNIEWAKAQDIIRVCESNGITRPELESLDFILSKYVKNYRLKENVVKDCLNCKNNCHYPSEIPCSECGINFEKWEAKDNG